MNQIGLKLFSTNRQYIKYAVELCNKKVYQYIELYTVPGSYGEYKDEWKNLSIPYVIHAPHTAHGLNLAKSENEKRNMELADEAKRYADYLEADIIIYHPGNDGHIEEAAADDLLALGFGAHAQARARLVPPGGHQHAKAGPLQQRSHLA